MLFAAFLTIEVDGISTAFLIKHKMLRTQGLLALINGQIKGSFPLPQITRNIVDIGRVAGCNCRRVSKKGIPIKALLDVLSLEIWADPFLEGAAIIAPNGEFLKVGLLRVAIRE